MTLTNGHRVTRKYEQLGYYTEALNASITKNNHYYDHSSRQIYLQFLELKQDFDAELIVLGDYHSFLQNLK